MDNTKSLSFMPQQRSTIIQIKDVEKVSPDIGSETFFINLNHISRIEFKYYISKKNLTTGNWDKIELKAPIVMLFDEKVNSINISYENFLKYVAPYIENLNI